MVFIEVKALGGVNYIRASDVLAVRFSDRERCNVIMPGGISIPCTEPAEVVAARIAAAVEGVAATPDLREAAPAPASAQETAHGDASE